MLVVAAACLNGYSFMCKIEDGNGIELSSTAGMLAIESYDVPIIHLPEKLIAIESEAFASNIAKYVIVPTTVTEIGSLAFANCTDLSVIEIPIASVTIGTDAFTNCPNMFIVAPTGGTVEQYAKENNIMFVAK